MLKLNPYLNFAGKTEAAFNFYRSVFGGEFAMVQRFKDSGHGDDMSPEDREKIMHIALPIGEHVILMGTDTIEAFGQTLKEGDNFSLSISTSSEEEAQKIYEGLAVNGQSTMPLEKTFWGAYFGMLTDQFGIQWMVSYDEKYK
jgi:PhnB protein